MKTYDYVITGLQSWDIPIGSNAIDITKEISKTHRVLYVNSPLDVMTLLRRNASAETVYRKKVLRGKTEPLRKINDRLWVLDFTSFVWSVNELPDGFVFDFVNKLNNKTIFQQVQKTIQTLGFKNIIHFIDNDIYRSFYAKELLNPALSVYYRRDNLQPFPYWKKHVARLEPQLISKSDLVLCNSPQLAEFAGKYNQKSFDIGQGVDLSAYNPSHKYAVPSSLDPIPHPRIGYIGDINSLRLDADLIHDLAASRPNYSFVMIGREDEVFQSHALHQLPNVYFLGSIPKADVPQYMAALDVCMNPQAINEITIGNYPRKVDEYLAMGKPVLATATKTMELFKHHVYLCQSLQEYQAATDRAVLCNDQQKKQARIEFARSHSWQNNVQSILNHINQNLKN